MSKSVYVAQSFALHPYQFCEIEAHPWAGEDLSLKIDERDQTIWICMLEL